MSPKPKSLVCNGRKMVRSYSHFDACILGALSRPKKADTVKLARGSGQKSLRLFAWQCSLGLEMGGHNLRFDSKSRHPKIDGR
jgi:hypothetical protein